MTTFSQKIFKLGINPCVDVPETVLKELFRNAGRTRGPIPVRGKLNGKRFRQTVVKYGGSWRLYLNGRMRLDAGIDVGDIAYVEIDFDPAPRRVPMNPKLKEALAKQRQAKIAFEQLPPSHRKEILRYLNSMKTEASLTRNIEKLLRRLMMKEAKHR